MLALENRRNLMTLELKLLSDPFLADVEPSTYGDPANEGKEFDITSN